MNAVTKNRNDAALEARGSLRSTPFAHLLVMILDQRRSGTLRLIDPRGEVHALVRFDNGMPVGARSNSMGATLLQSLIPLCACADGDYLFVGDQDEVGLDEGAVIGRVDPVALINAAMRGPVREDVVQATIDLLAGRALRLHPRTNLDRYKLTPPEREIVDALAHEPITLEELLARPDANERQVRRLLYVLKITRALSFVPERASGRGVSGTIERVVPPSVPPAGLGARVSTPAQAPRARSSAQPPPPPPARAARAGSKPPPLPSQRVLSETMQRPPNKATLIEAALPLLEAGNAGRYHVHYDQGGPTDVLPPARPKSERAPRRSLPASAEAKRQRLSEADALRKDAELLLRRSDYPAALQAAHQALRADGSAANEALFGWLLYLSAGDPNRVPPRAFRHLERAVERDSDCVDGHYYLGVLLKRVGNDDEAYAHFRRVLRLRPNHEGAAREMRLRALRKSQSSSGFMAKLFGGKSDKG